MSTEKIIKTQSKKYLSGNWITVISAILVLCTIGVTLESVFWLVTIFFGIVSVETGAVNEGREILYTVAVVSESVAGLILSPIINGIFKMFAKIVNQRSCEINDMFYFFGNFRRYSRTVLMNLVLFVLFMFFGELTNVYGYICMLFGSDYFQSFGFNVETLIFAVAGVVTLVIKALLYLIILNYPLIAYGMDDSKGIMKYIFGYTALSFKNLWKTVKLVFSFIWLIMLCFFVAPAFYVVPYLLTALTDSAKWLFEIENTKINRFGH